MQRGLVGVPYPVWGLLCLAMALVWVFVWPRDRATANHAARAFVLRWFHALVWVLLALAAFIAGWGPGDTGAVARGVAGLALLSYGVFMFVFVTSGR